MNFFANYSSIVQALMSRMDAILNRINKLIEKDKAGSSSDFKKNEGQPSKRVKV
jgi:hypothetical protein